MRVIVVSLLSLIVVLDGAAFAREGFQRREIDARSRETQVSNRSCAALYGSAGVPCSKRAVHHARRKPDAGAVADRPVPMARRDRPGRYFLRGPRF
ncbi:exported hypothetical protein [Bradyrhizobium sp. ORS 375]|nr:exported hypothetical protein [Bradyrhizobium sp. ORS 375]